MHVFHWRDFVFVGHFESRIKKLECAQAARAHAFSLVRKGCKRTMIARHCGSGQMEPRTNPFGGTHKNSPPHGAQTICAPVFSPRETRRKNPLTSHAVSGVLCCLGLPSAVTQKKVKRENSLVIQMTDYAAASCVQKCGFTKKLTLKIDCAPNSFLEAKAAPAESDCVAREGIFAWRAKTNLSMCLRPREWSSLGRFAEQVGS